MRESNCWIKKNINWSYTAVSAPQPTTQISFLWKLSGKQIPPTTLSTSELLLPAPTSSSPASPVSLIWPLLFPSLGGTTVHSPSFQSNCSILLIALESTEECWIGSLRRKQALQTLWGLLGKFFGQSSQEAGNSFSFRNEHFQYSQRSSDLQGVFKAKSDENSKVYPKNIFSIYIYSNNFHSEFLSWKTFFARCVGPQKDAPKCQSTRMQYPATSLLTLFRMRPALLGPPIPTPSEEEAVT